MLHSHLSCFKKICHPGRVLARLGAGRSYFMRKKRCSGVLPYFLRVDWNTFPAVEALVFICLRNPLILRE